MNQPTIFDISNKHILITGASSGFGWHFAKFLAQQKAKVTVTARRLEKLEALVAEIQAEGGIAHALQLDVAEEQQIPLVLQQAEAQFGPVQVLINNAGVAHGGRAESVTVTDYDWLMGINLRGAWAVAVAVAKSMIANKVSGSIINIASILGERVIKGSSIYAISKAGVVQMTKAHALEWSKYGIRVNALQPGYFRTPLNEEMFATEYGAKLLKNVPFRRTGNLPELEGPLLLLASDASSYMSGATISVDGGHLVSSL